MAPFLFRFSTCVYNNVPPSQALSIFQIFIDHLSSTDTAEQPAKKRKTSSAKTSSQLHSHRLIIELLCQFLISIRLSQQQKLAFSDNLLEVSNNIVMKRLDIADDVDNIRMALPAIQLHQALLHTFSDVYFNVLSAGVKEELSSYLHQIIGVSSRHSTNVSLTTLLSAVSSLSD